MDRSGASSFHLIFDKWIQIRGDYFRFDLVFIKKIIKSKFFFTKTTEPESKPIQTDWFRFGSVFRIKTD